MMTRSNGLWPEAAAPAEELVGAHTAVHGLDLVPEANQHPPSGAQLNRLVVDDEDACVSPRRGQHRLAALLAVDEREVERDRGPHARRAGDVDEALVLLDDAVDDGEAQAGARGLLGALLREERFEHLAKLVRLDAAAVVGDGQRRVAARPERSRSPPVARATSTRALLTTTLPFPATASTALRIRLSTARASCDSEPRTTSGVADEVRASCRRARRPPRRTEASCWPSTT